MSEEHGSGSQDEVAADPSSAGYSAINIRNISIKCGQCETYQTLSSYRPGPERNVYTYECENERCDPAVTRTLVEVPRELDEFARRDPAWRGGRRFGGEE